MPKSINDSARSKIVNAASEAGFVVQLKPGGGDKYTKNLMFFHAATDQTIYVRKDRDIDSAGEPRSYTVAIHPSLFDESTVASVAGVERARNSRNNGYLFASSNYRAFPEFSGFGEPCGFHLEANNLLALKSLLQALAGDAKANVETPYREVPVAPTKRATQERTEPAPGHAAPAADTAAVSGLVIRREPIQQILSGVKTWEMRSKATHKRGLIALIEKGSGTVVGAAELVGCVGPLSEQEMRDNIHRHGISADRLGLEEIKAWRTAWVLKRVYKLAQPVSYLHPSGAVTWVSLPQDVVNKVLDQISSLSPLEDQFD